MTIPPLRDIQALYFDILDRFFAKYRTLMERKHLDCNQVAKRLERDEGAVRAFAAEKDDIFDALTSFWDEYGSIVRWHLDQLECLKTVFGGDIFPHTTET